MAIPKNTLIYDIECATNGYAVNDMEKHTMKFFGAYSYKFNKFYFYTNKESAKIQLLFKSHKFLVGFNNNYYDNVILKQENFNLNYKIIVDLLKIVQQRMSSIMFNGSPLAYQLENLKLKTIVETLELVDEDNTKGEIDYSLFNKDEFTEEELKEIKKYTLQDIEITKKLWEWLFEQFDNWKHHIDIEDANRLKHITSAPSVYAYKVICHKSGIKEEYASEPIYSNLTDGAFVSYPAIEKLEGNIYCLDFASLYPHIMIQCNLFGRTRDGTGWNGNNKFDTLGYYDDKNISKISYMLQSIYKERKEYKKNKDPREYGLKITMNTIYGLLRNPNFKNVYDDIAGNDCCTIGQQWIRLAIKRFKEAGYFVFYTDTDSIYLEDVFNDREKMLNLKDDIMKEIKDNIPFPVDTFDMDIDYEIEYIQFFKSHKKQKEDEDLDEDDLKAKELNLLKKNYLFVYKVKNGVKLFIKNLGIVKRSNSKLSKKIFWNKMTPIIMKEHNSKFQDSTIKEWIKEYLDEDISFICKRISVSEKDTYKSKTCINVQIYDYIPKDEDTNLGAGNHLMIPNKKLGVGKGMAKYCTLEEYKKYLNYNDLNLNVIMRELSYFNENYIPEKLTKIKVIPFEDTLKQLGLW